MRATEPAPWRLAVAALLLVLLLAGPGVTVLIVATERRSAELLQQEAAGAAETVGRALGQQLSRAVELGIPLAEIPAVEPYLEDMLRRMPAVLGIAIHDRNDMLLFSVGTITIDGAERGSRRARIPIRAQGTEVGRVDAIATASAAIGMNRLLGLAGLFVLTAAVGVGIAVGLLAYFRLQRPYRALLATLERIADGAFDAPMTPAGRDAVARAFTASAKLAETVTARYRSVLARAEAIRALDFDGSLTRRIEHVLAPLNRTLRRTATTAVAAAPDPTAGRGRLLLRTRVVLLALLAAVATSAVLIATGWQRERVLEGRFAAVAISAQDALWRQMTEAEATRLQNLTPRLLYDDSMAAAVASGDRATIAAALSVVAAPLRSTGEIDALEIVDGAGELLYSASPIRDPRPMLDAGSIDSVLRGSTVVGLRQVAAQRFLLVAGFPVLQGQRIVGVATVGVDVARVLADFARTLDAPSALLSLRGRLVAATDPELASALPPLPPREASVVALQHGDTRYSVTGVPIRELTGGHIGLVVSLRDATTSLEQIRRVTLWSILGVSGFLLLLLIGLYRYLQGAFLPLDNAIEVLGALARGDTSVSLETGRRDEIGRIADTVGRFRADAIALADARARQERQRRRQERLIRRQMETLAAALDDTTRDELLQGLRTAVERQNDDQLGLLAGVLRQLSTRIIGQHRRLTELVAELRESLVTRTRLAALEQELDIARRVQSAIVPTVFPQRSEFEIHGYMVPAREVGGDFYDFFDIDAEHLGVVIADVSDKGVPAALFMAISRTLLKATALFEPSPSACISRLNDLLAAENEQMMFVTLFYGVLHLPSGRLDYVNAGHNPPYVIGREGLSALPATGGCAVAVFEDRTFRETSHILAAGDTLFLYTDGVSEAFDIDGEAFGEARLEALLEELGELPVERIAERVVAAIRGFERGADQADDITCLSLRRSTDNSDTGNNT